MYDYLYLALMLCFVGSDVDTGKTDTSSKG